MLPAATVRFACGEPYFHIGCYILLLYIYLLLLFLDQFQNTLFPVPVLPNQRGIEMSGKSTNETGMLESILNWSPRRAPAGELRVSALNTNNKVEFILKEGLDCDSIGMNLQRSRCRRRRHYHHHHHHHQHNHRRHLHRHDSLGSLSPVVGEPRTASES